MTRILDNPIRKLPIISLIVHNKLLPMDQDNFNLTKNNIVFQKIIKEISATTTEMNHENQEVQRSLEEEEEVISILTIMDADMTEEAEEEIVEEGSIKIGKIIIKDHETPLDHNESKSLTKMINSRPLFY